MKKINVPNVNMLSTMGGLYSLNVLFDNKINIILNKKCMKIGM